MLELKNIFKKYEEHTVLNNISVVFPDCGLIGIQGKSGCGKSTLLSIIGMLDRDYEGKIDYHHQPIENPQDFIQNHIAFVMQNHDYIASMTVKENIVLPSLISSHAYHNKSLHSYCRCLEMDTLLERYPHELSGGQVKRMSIIKALLKDADIILCDEPTGPLHWKQSHEVMKILKDISLKALVIVVSHEQDLLSLYCDDVLTLESGKLLGTITCQRTCALSVPNKKHRLMLAYPLRQFWHQRYKLSFLFVFQWLIMTCFLLFVCGLCGVIHESHQLLKQDVYAHVMTIENKTHEAFEQLLKSEDIVRSYYDYSLESLSDDYHVDILPKSTKHIVLKEGRLPQQKHEILVNEQCHQRIGQKVVMQNQEYMVVGIVKDNLFSFQEKKAYILLDDVNSFFLQDQQRMVIETQSSKTKDVYSSLMKDYYVYSEVIENQQQVQSLLSLLKGVGMIFIGLSVLISILFIMIVESVIYLEREHDIAYLLSLGLTSKRYFSLSLSEAFLYALGMSVGGICLFSLLYYYFNDVVMIEKSVYFSLRLPVICGSRYDVFLIVFLMYFGLSFFCFMKNSKHMLKQKVMDVLREE